MKYPEMRDGHEAVHADLPSRKRKRVGLYGGPSALRYAQVTHWGNCVVLKNDAEAICEDVIEDPDREDFLRENRTPTEPDRDRGHGQSQRLRADVAQSASTAAVRGGLGHHDRERFGGARAIARGFLRP